MKFHVPPVLYARPSFWPWVPGQRLGFEDGSWSYTALEHQLLLAWWKLPAGAQPADAAPFLTALQAGDISELLPQAVLRLLTAKRLVCWSAWYSTWYRTDPESYPVAEALRLEDAADVLEQRLRFHTIFSDSRALYPAWLLAAHGDSRGFTTHSRTPSPPQKLLESGAIIWRGRWERARV